MTLAETAEALETASRQGAAEDRPEGARFIVMSDTLATEIAAAIRRIDSRVHV